MLDACHCAMMLRRKWRGVSGERAPPRDKLAHMLWAWLGSLLSILAIAGIHAYVSPAISLPVLVASFGASAVLLFGVPDGKLSRPRNFLGKLAIAGWRLAVTVAVNRVLGH